MGCGASKPEADEDTVAVLLRPFRHRIEEIGQRRPGGVRDGKDGTVFTTRHPHRQEEGDAATDEDASRGGSVATGGSGGRGEEGKGKEEDGGKRTKKQGGAGEVERGKGGKEEEEADGSLRGPALVRRGRDRSEGLDDLEMPGSPSFRVYFEGSVPGSSDDDWSNSGEIKGEGEHGPGRKDSIDSNNSEPQESQAKTPKRYNVRRFKGLAKGSSAVYGLLNVRSRYSQTALSRMTTPAQSRHNASSCNSSGSNNNNTPKENPTAI